MATPSAAHDPTPLHVPKITLEQVTPQMASQYLGTSAGNRNAKKRAVSRYARDMILGRWVLNGEAIKFDRAGHLIDGHHRLLAIMEAKMTIPLLVIRGVQEGAMLTLDTGVGRSFMDAQAVRGNHVANTLGPILRWWYRYEVTHMNFHTVPTHAELQEVLEAHPHTVESARLMGRLKVVRSRCTPGIQGFVHAYASYRYDREMADEFMQELNDGAALNRSSPILLLRQRLVDTPSKMRMDPIMVLALTIKAWNAWISKGTLGALRWIPEGEKQEAFPVFKGDEERFAKARMLREQQNRQQKVELGKQQTAMRTRGPKGYYNTKTGGAS
jgi:hypothetical protein